MKWCGYILAFYQILLSAVPCCIYDDCANEQTELTASHDNEDKDCGNCSPFFSCEGCATALIDFDPALPGNIPVNATTIFPACIQISLPEVDYDFWQPPKTG